jgi:hypothetical protein
VKEFELSNPYNRRVNALPLPLENGAWLVPNTLWCDGCGGLTYTHNSVHDPGKIIELHSIAHVTDRATKGRKNNE